MSSSSYFILQSSHSDFESGNQLSMMPAYLTLSPGRYQTSLSLIYPPSCVGCSRYPSAFRHVLVCGRLPTWLLCS
jgi:hypothetical protein